MLFASRYLFNSPSGKFISLGRYWGFRFFSLQQSGIFVAIIAGLILPAPAERYFRSNNWGSDFFRSSGAVLFLE
jgi:hypothetical protein